VATLNQVQLWADTYEQFAELWCELTQLLEDLGVIEMLEQSAPLPRRYLVDHLCRVIDQIDGRFGELDDAAADLDALLDGEICDGRAGEDITAG
jgi:hypothetical protein